MTTTIKFHVNGNYETTIVQKNGDGSSSTVTISGAKKGEGDEYSAGLPHPAAATFDVSERYLGEAAPRGDTTEGA